MWERRDFQLEKYPIAWGAGEEEYNDHLHSEHRIIYFLEVPNQICKFVAASLFKPKI